MGQQPNYTSELNLIKIGIVKLLWINLILRVVHLGSMYYIKIRLSDTFYYVVPR